VLSAGSMDYIELILLQEKSSSSQFPGQRRLGHQIDQRRMIHMERKSLPACPASNVAMSDASTNTWNSRFQSGGCTTGTRVSKSLSAAKAFSSSSVHENGSR
jgi:hypothetical protein